MSKKKIVALMIVAILIMITLGLRIAYSFLDVKVEPESSTGNVNIKSCLEINLDDTDSKAINLTDTYPMDDNKGLETESYQFKVGSSCETYVGFNLYLTTLKENEIDDSLIKFAITTINDEVLIMDNLKTDKITNELTSDELKEIAIGLKEEQVNIKNIYKVYSNNITLQGESTYKLHIWVDKDAGNETMGQSFKVGLSVKPYDREETLAEYLIKNKDNSLIYHDGSIKDEEGNVIDASDYSYRYAGDDEVVTKNYVCLDGTTTEGKCEADADLYRIIGLFKNDLNLYEMKLIKADYATSEQLGVVGAYKDVYSSTIIYYKGNQENLSSIGGFYWKDSNTNFQQNDWKISQLRSINLNSYYLNYLKDIKKIDIDNIIVNHIWQNNGYKREFKNIENKLFYDYEMGNINDDNDNAKYEVSDKIGLIYVSDYVYAKRLTSQTSWIVDLTTQSTSLSQLSQDNWLYLGLNEWTISKAKGYIWNAWLIQSTGKIIDDNITKFPIAVRPSFYLSSNTKLKNGAGEKDNPYRITI